MADTAPAPLDWDGFPPERDRSAFYWIRANEGVLKVVHWSGRSWNWRRMGRASSTEPHDARRMWVLLQECDPPTASNCAFQKEEVPA